jgi:hypothetical protein
LREAGSDNRSGEFLLVHVAEASKIILENPGAAGPSAQYTGMLSEDGQAVTGNWTEDGGGRLNAPDKFRKVPDYR